MPDGTFELSSIQRGGKRRTSIEFVSAGHSIALPLLVVRGQREGKTLVASAGVHGDEYEGIRTILDLFEELDPQTMAGDFVGLSVANPPAFWNGTRTSPLDQGNLARVFPGARDGSPTETIAFHIDRYLLSIADFYLDLHSAGILCEMPAMVGYHEPDVHACEAALIFGMPVVWCHPTVAAGRTVSSAIERGVPALYLEARGAGRIDAGDLALYKRGTRNLLKHLGILNGEIEHGPEPLHLYGDGNVDASMSSSHPGFLIPAVELLQSVVKDQLLGRIVDLWGRELETFHSLRDGRVALIHAQPLVQVGEPLFLITGTLP